MPKLPPNDASILALMAQYPGASSGKLRQLRQLLGPEGRRIARAMTVTGNAFRSHGGGGSSSAAMLTANGLRTWARGNRYSALDSSSRKRFAAAPGKKRS